MQRSTIFAILGAALVLGGCSTPAKTSLDEALKNPLFAYAYYQDLADHMVNIEIAKDPMLENEEMKALVTSTRLNAVEQAHSADRERKRGLGGDFVRAKESIIGHALVLDDKIFFSPDFSVAPGLAIRVYLSSVLDPRDLAVFPSAEDRDFGPLQSISGEQVYSAAIAESKEPLRTVVLYDTKLKRLYAFAQLHEEL